MAARETKVTANRFEDMWTKVEQDFEKKTGRKLRGTGSAHDPKDLTKQFLDKLKPQDTVETGSSRRKQKAREVVGYVLEFVRTLGDFIGQGLTMAFGAPAEIGFNAFKFLIDIPKKIDATWDYLIKLFEEMSSTLLEFEVLKKIPADVHVDEELLIVYHKMLIAFVSICGRHIKLLESGKLYRWLRNTKRIFLDNDSGVEDDLENFRDLARRQGSMLNAANFKDTAITRHKVDDMHDIVTSDNRERQIQLELKRKLLPIAERLRVKREIADDHLQTLSSRHDKVEDEVCRWVFDTSEYQKWIDPGSKRHLLCIAGDEKTGKAFLLAAISRSLKASVHTEKRAVLYYDFALRSNGEPSFKLRHDSVETALKVLALQSAQNSLNHATFLESALLQTHSLDEKNVSKLWASLKFSESFNSVGQETYVLLNGLDRLERDSSRELVEFLAHVNDPRNDWPKILVTGPNSLFHGVEDSALVLKVKEHNESGVRWYVENEIRQIEILQGNDVEIAAVKRDLVERLPDKVSRDFVAMQQKLSQVKTAINDEKTREEVLAVLDKDLDAVSEDKRMALIGELQESLEADDIENLNLMLARLVYGYGPYWPTVKELDAILLLHGRPRPVLPLEKRLKSKYLDILDVGTNYVALNQGFESFFKSSHVRSEFPRADKSKISLKVEIDRADRRSMKQILWNLGERFDFDDLKLVDYKLDSHRIEIGVDAVKAHFFMVETCLQYFSEDKNTHTKAFESYSKNVFKHLNEWRKLKPAAEDMKIICQKLINFFDETSVLEDKWSLSGTEVRDWISADTLRVMEEVFEAAEKSVKFEPRDKRWIEKKVRSKENRGDIWQPITLLVARNWLQDRQWPADLCSRWIHSFIELTKQDRGDNGSPNEDTKNLSLDEQISRAADWCKDHLNIDTSGAIYHERLASAFLQRGRVSTAEELLEKAARSSRLDWRVNKELAKAYTQLERPADAIKQLIMAIEQLQSSYEDRGQQRELVDLLSDLAQAQQKSGDTEAALQSYERLLEVDPFREFRDEASPVMDHCFKESFKLLPIGNDARAKDLICGKELKYARSIQDLQRRLDAAYGHYPADTAASYWLVVVMQDEKIARRIEEALEHICERKRSEKNTNIPAHWFYISGIVFCRSKHPDLYEKGLNCLRECVKYAGSNHPNSYVDLTAVYPSIVSRKANRQLSTWKSFSISAMEPGHQDFASEWERFENFIKTTRKSFEFEDMSAGKSPLTFLCRYYVLHGMHDKACELVRQDVREGLVILEDDDPENDTDGFKLLAEAFKCVGDDLGALTAWSQMAPTDLDTESRKDAGSASTRNANGTDAKSDSKLEHPTRQGMAHRPGNLNYECDGTCGRRWYYADDLWSCKYCFDIQFCSDCHESLKRRQLRRIICHPEHEFLYVPRWSDDEYFAVGKDRLRVNGELGHDGRMVNGDIVGFKEWLKGIHRDWDI